MNSKNGKYIDDLFTLPPCNSIYIYGAGGFGHHVVRFIECYCKHLKISAFLDDNPEKKKSGKFPIEKASEKLNLIKDDANACIIVAIQLHENIIPNLEMILRGKKYFIASSSLQEWLKKFFNANPCQQESFPKIIPFNDNCIEPNIQMAVRDLCHYGDVVYDVGANIGGVSLAMSKTVGPRGIVCSFEASRRIMLGLFENIRDNMGYNIYLYEKAVCDKSGKSIKIYHGDSWYQDSIISSMDKNPFSIVQSIALDDFAEETQLYPRLVKMDIEGAEILALKGMTKILKEVRPYLILEQEPDQKDCFDFLASYDYLAWDLDDYSEIRDRDYYEKKSLLNVLFIHQSDVHSTLYAGLNSEFFMKIGTSEFESFSEDGISRLRKKLVLDAGRYVAKINLGYELPYQKLHIGATYKGHNIVSYHSDAIFLNNSYASWPIDIDETGELDIFIENIEPEHSAYYNTVELYKIACLKKRTIL